MPKQAVTQAEVQWHWKPTYLPAPHDGFHRYQQRLADA